ncbi:MAG: TIGR04282 family arsenosugar biosynthesis glycosyltransferase [Acidobacteriota bacterium]|nr:TIGR04282 family arsenosugar biosynthesis glycosyltransferase [Acidobacteriota bacterium]
MPDRLALLFTKPARPGHVKTRLIGDLSAQQAADLQVALLTDLTERLADGNFELRLAWAVAEPDQLPASCVPALRQSGDDLGERLYNALAAAAVESPSVAAIGSDHPELSSTHLEQAFEAVESRLADVVLGPTRDGGYYLFAAARHAVRREIFAEVSWSTSAVLDETRERCAALSLRTHLLEPTSDVDTPEDLKRLTSALAEGSVVSPNTAALLRSWGRLSGEEG